MIDTPTKVFPCDCGSEGLTVRCCGDYASVEEDPDLKEFDGAPFINIAFWRQCANLGGGNKLSIWCRIKEAWAILSGKSPWVDMVCFKSGIAKNFANHILYLLSKNKDKSLVNDGCQPLVKE